jgi:hypothetical protein
LEALVWKLLQFEMRVTPWSSLQSLVLLLAFTVVRGFASSAQTSSCHTKSAAVSSQFHQCAGDSWKPKKLALAKRRAVPRGGATALSGSAVASILAGSVAGAIGVGVAFPLDTLKTKAQVIGGGSMLQTIAKVYRQEGIAGFFGGVKGMMSK